MPNIGKIHTRTTPPQQGRRYRAPWYDTVQWRRERERHLRDNPLCVLCKAQGIVTAATIYDHIVPVGTYPPERREYMFWHGAKQGLCVTCHNKKSASERVTRGKTAHNELIEGNENI